MTLTPEETHILGQIRDTLASLFERGLSTAHKVEPQELRKLLQNAKFVPYDYQDFAMDAAQTDKEIGIEGDWLAIDTDGSLDGVTVRFNHKENPAVPIKYFNPWIQPFWTLYITWTAQAGKTLHVCVGRQGSAEMLTRTGVQVDVTDIKAKTDNLPTDPADQSAVEAAITAAHATTDGKVDAVQSDATAIKAKTDNLPTDPADQSAVEAAITAAHAITDGKVDAVQSDATAIKAKTDNLPTDPADQSAVEAAITVVHAITDGKVDAVQSDATAIKAKTDNLPTDPADQSAVEAAIAAAHATTDGKVDVVDGNVDVLITSTGRILLSMDFWSDPQEEVQLAQAAGTKSLPSVTVDTLPAGATVVRAVALFMARVIENTNAAANKLDGATVAGTSQVIQVRDDTPGTWRDAIKFVDDQFGVAASTREGGAALIGSVNIATEVDGNDTYEFQWLLAKADQDYLQFNDIQAGLRVWYSV